MCDVILGEENGECVATGIIFYYLSVPSVGIGTTILKQLIHCASQRGYDIVMLSASELGKPIYEKMGFQEIKNSMIYDGRCI